MSVTKAVIEEKGESDPRERQMYWITELKAAQKRLSKWHKLGVEIDERYKGNSKNTRMFKLNLFNSNVKTLMSMLYGNLPRVDVSRTDKTGNDDAGRVAALMMERILRANVANNANSYDSMLYASLQDRLLSGLGVARVRYVFEEMTAVTAVEAEAGDTNVVAMGEPQTTIFEDAPIDYYYWGDVLWGWGRTFDELPWIAFRSYMTKEEVSERFGEDRASTMEFKQQQVVDFDDSQSGDTDLDSAWQKAEVWEIWDKTEREVYWVNMGCMKVLDVKDDPLQLSSFYPCPPFMIANQTTSLYLPTPEFYLAQDLYNEIDKLQTRIAILTDAVKAVGVYDKSSEGVQRVFNEGVENDLIPVDNWAMFAEKGGLKGQIDWVPIEAVANALDRLRGLRDETIGLLQQVSGMSDIMRGSLSNQYEGVGQSQIKAKFGSTRVQALQESFARFVSDLMQIKAEIIARHFSPETIVKQSGIEFSFDADMIPAALDVIKNEDEFVLRVDIKPETLAQLDYAQLREERSMYLNGLSTFLQAASPLATQDPRSLPFLLEMLKWSMAGFKGASEIEGVLDDAIDAMKQPQAQQEAQKPDPEQIRAETQVKLEEMRMQAKMQEIQMKAQADMQMRAMDKQADIETEQARTQLEMMRINAEMEAEMAKLQAKMEADVRTEFLTSKFDAEQARETAQAQVQAQIIKSRTEMANLKQQNRVDVAMKMFEKQADMQMKREEMAKNRQMQGSKDET